MEGDKTNSSANSSGKSKLSREQKRRHLTKSASHDRSAMMDRQQPLFGRPAVVEKKDSELHARLHNIFGDYNNYKTAMMWEKQTSYFGVADATPSTPIQGSKYNPFDSEFRAASSRGAPSSSGTSSSNKHTSRHQVAEPPSSSQQYVSKKDKSRTKLHPKHLSKTDVSSQQLQQQQRPHSGMATSSHKGGEGKKLSTAVEGLSGETSQATNVLKSKPKKEKVRPYKPQVTGQNTATVSVSTSSSSHSKNAPPTSSSSLFDFSAPAASASSSNSLSFHRSSSNSSTTSTASKPKLSVASERPGSISSTPSSRHGDSHVTQSHSNSAAISHHHTHKHSKKLAPVVPTVGTSSASGKSQDIVDSPRVVSIKRTSSLEFVKQTPSWDKGVASETAMPPATGETHKDESHNTGKTKGKKKEKKLRKKLKKDKEMAAEKKADISNPPTSSHTVVSATGHVSTAESHMTTKPLTAARVKVEPTRSRPSDLKITTAGLVDASMPAKAPGPAPPVVAESASAGLSSMDEESQDTGDIHSMLQEMMKPLNHLYSLVTPIPTPNKARPFVFPTATSSGQVSSVSVLGSSEQDVFKKPSTSDTSQMALPQGGIVSSVCPRKLSSTSSSDDELDTDRKMAVEMAVTALDLNLAEEHAPPPPRPASPALSLSSSSSSSAESSSDSSDSSSEGEGDEGEEEGEESESNITPTLEKLHRQTQLSGAAITPLKKTPPRVGLSSTSSLLTDESANLSPAKPFVRMSTSSFQSHSNDSNLVNQVSTGFNIPPIPQMDSSDSDSGSESDSESSDSEDDQSSGEENNSKINNTAAGGTENSRRIKRASIPSSDDLSTAPFGSSTGFFDDGYDLLGATSQFGEHQPSKQLRQQQQDSENFIEDEAMDTGGSSTSNTVVMTAAASNSNSEKHSRTGRKRKHSSVSSHFSLRKAQKLMSTVQLSSDAEDGEALSHNRNATSAPLPLTITETTGKKKSISHLSVSEMNYGSEDEEEGEIPSDDEEQAKKPLSRQQSMETSSSELPPHQHTTTDLLSSRANQGGATSSGSGMESMKQEEEEGEANSLVVSFQLSNIPKLPLQKPKATVEPFFHNNTSTSKVARRRNTLDAPGERDGDEVQPRGMSRERGERSTYNRHRDEYGGRDYHRPPRSHRWDRDSSRDRRMYGGSEERSGRHGGSSRHGSGWDRDGDYHRSSDDYWMDGGGGGTHYDRGTRDYERGSRQPDRKRGAEYFMQEARRRKHEADKIGVPGADKAKAYMESVPFFMKHGDAIEHERQQQNQQWTESGGGGALKRNPFKMYSDTLSVVRFCQNMAGDCKPLVVVCLRCQSILLWRMFQLKQASASHAQKELQEFFVLSKGAQSKSPYPNNFSPLPSPASVSSTASNGSGGGAFPQDPSPSCSTSIPKHIYNKAAEHLTIAGYVNQSFDTWKAADSMMEQCREFFAKAERKSSSRIYQFSSNISQAANWVENMLRSLR